MPAGRASEPAESSQAQGAADVSKSREGRGSIHEEQALTPVHLFFSLPFSPFVPPHATPLFFTARSCTGARVSSRRAS